MLEGRHQPHVAFRKLLGALPRHGAHDGHPAMVFDAVAQDPLVAIAGHPVEHHAGDLTSGSNCRQPDTTAAMVRVVLVQSMHIRTGRSSSLASSAVLVVPSVSMPS
jgi:hypothetical protein